MKSSPGRATSSPHIKNRLLSTGQFGRCFVIIYRSEFFSKTVLTYSNWFDIFNSRLLEISNKPEKEKVRMSEEQIILHCSPTLAGMKTANMFTASFYSYRDMCDTLRDLNNRLAQKGVRVIPLKYNDGKALVYLFRPDRLKTDLKGYLAGRLLEKRGYHTGNIRKCITRLCRRLSDAEEFPHEIGLFLGYPPKDVLGFIMEKAGRAISCSRGCTGCWKVYGDDTKARDTFARYRKCTEVYIRKWKGGSALENLTVKAI